MNSGNFSVSCDDKSAAHAQHLACDERRVRQICDGLRDIVRRAEALDGRIFAQGLQHLVRDICAHIRLESAISAPLVAEYAASHDAPTCPHMDEMFTIAPDWRASIDGSAARMQ